MASSQQDHNVAQLNADEKAIVDKAIDEAKNFLENNQNANDAIQYQLAMVAGTIKNYQKSPVTMMKTHNFQGKFLVNPPPEISSNGTGHFLHEGATTIGVLQVIAGSKAAIIYADSVRGWLVSWYRPDNVDEPSKVYAEFGPKNKFVNMDWQAIEKKLDASGQISHFARIHDLGNKRAVLAAVFQLYD